MLPHAIIVFNATDVNVDEKEWDVTKATQMLMTDIRDAIIREPVLQDYGMSIVVCAGTRQLIRVISMSDFP